MHMLIVLQKSIQVFCVHSLLLLQCLSTHNYSHQEYITKSVTLHKEAPPSDSVKHVTDLLYGHAMCKLNGMNNG